MASACEAILAFVGGPVAWIATALMRLAKTGED